MIQHLTYLYQFNLQFAETLVKDLKGEQMVEQPNGVINHPAWSLGHLAVSADHLGEFLGLDSALPDGWGEMFKTGGTPSGDVAAYPSKDRLLEVLAAQHQRNTDAVRSADLAQFAEPHPNEGTRKYFPTVGDMVMFLMTSHEMDHLGQVAAWRRAMGLGSTR